MGAHNLEKILRCHIHQVLFQVANGIVNRDGPNHCRGIFDQFFAEFTRLPIVTQIHDGFRTELHRQLNFLHFCTIVGAIAGNPQIHIDFCPQPLAHSIRVQRLVPYICGNDYPPCRHQRKKFFLRIPFFLCYNRKFFGNNSFFRCFHLRLIFHVSVSFIQSPRHWSNRSYRRRKNGWWGHIPFQ